MPFSLYEISVPVFIRNLRVLQGLLAKAQAHPTVSSATLTELRLISDMLPFTFQVQSVCNVAKIQAVLVGGLENFVVEDSEKTFPELVDRVAKTIAFLETVKPDSMDGKEEVNVREMPRKGTTVPLNGKQYISEHALPNFFFHLSMAFAILRKEGVDVGKRDFLGLDI